MRAGTGCCKSGCYHGETGGGGGGGGGAWVSEMVPGTWAGWLAGLHLLMGSVSQSVPPLQPLPRVGSQSGQARLTLTAQKERKHANISTLH